ncbi:MULTISPECIES: fluoride efflux transporter FluC [Micrococcaceae]|uniref:fluoride efflux transporter FluC n=1 Tax=unclassified Kocuria TaxID=2649579 RepID=UPI001010EE18|nr:MULTISPECIES: CrcB family protein [unclassified Kocuria]
MIDWLFLGVALAGGAGAAVRMFLDGVLRSVLGSTMPWATNLINLSGSLLLGFLAGLLMAQTISSEVQITVGAGFMGGYTTFSTASVETFRLVQERRWGAALINAFGMVFLATGAAAAGLMFGTLWG